MGASFCFVFEEFGPVCFAIVFEEGGVGSGEVVAVFQVWVLAEFDCEERIEFAFFFVSIA